MPLAVARRDRVQRGEPRNPSLRSSSRLTLARALGVSVVPFVDRDHQRAARLEDEAGDVRVLLGDVRRRIDQQHDDVGILDRLQRLDHRKLLDRLGDLAALAHAGGVDQRVVPRAAVEVEIQRVARRARLVEGDHALLAEQRIDQRRFADVRAPDDRDLDAPVARLRPPASSVGRAWCAGHSASASSTRSRTLSPCADEIGSGVAERQLVEVGRGALGGKPFGSCSPPAAPAGPSAAADRRSCGPARSALRGHRPGKSPHRTRRSPARLLAPSRARCRSSPSARSRRCRRPDTGGRRRGRVRSGGRASAPGKSATSAARDCVRRLNSVDLPTLGRPTRTIVGSMFRATAPSASASARVSRCLSDAER